MPKYNNEAKKSVPWTPQMIEQARFKNANRTAAKKAAAAAKKAAAAAKKAADEAAAAYRKYWKGIIGADPEYFKDREGQRIVVDLTVEEEAGTNTPVTHTSGGHWEQRYVHQNNGDRCITCEFFDHQ